MLVTVEGMTDSQVDLIREEVSELAQESGLFEIENRHHLMAE